MTDLAEEMGVHKAVEEIAQLEATEGFTPDIHLRAEAVQNEFSKHRYRWDRDMQFARFMELVAIDEVNDCWNWQGAHSSDNHPVFSPITGRHVMAAHFIMLHSGHPRPSKSMVIVRRCDNNGCVNPGHLMWVSRSQMQKIKAAQRGRT